MLEYTPNMHIDTETIIWNKQHIFTHIRSNSNSLSVTLSNRVSKVNFNSGNGRIMTR